MSFMMRLILPSFNSRFRQHLKNAHARSTGNTVIVLTVCSTAGVNCISDLGSL